MEDTTYRLVVYRSRADEENATASRETLIERTLTADEVIEMMRPTQAEPEVESKAEKKKDVVKQIKKKNVTVSVDIDAPKKRKTSYDRDAIVEDINRGLKVDEIAHRHGVTVSVVKNVRFLYAKKGDAPKASSNPNKDKIRRLHQGGASEAEIYSAMHDFMTDGEFRKALEEVKAE